MATWNDVGYETDAIRLFVRDRSRQRIDDANAERLAHQIHATLNEPMQPMRAHRHRKWQLIHLHQPHLTH